MSVSVYTLTGFQLPGQPTNLGVNQCSGQLLYPSVGNTEIDAYADIIADITATLPVPDIGIYYVYCSPAYILTPPLPSNLGQYPSNPPRRYYGNVTYGQGEYIRKLCYINYEKGVLDPFAFGFSLAVPRPGISPSPSPLLPVFVNRFRNSTWNGQEYNGNFIYVNDTYIYADTLRTYNSNSNADIDIILPYTVALAGKGQQDVGDTFGYFYV